MQKKWSLLSIILIASSTLAADISGKIQVMERDGNKSLSSHEHAVVYLTGITSPAPKKALNFDQKNKQFTPRLLPVVVGQQINFWNRDRIKHNVFSTDKRKQFDLGRYPSGEFKSVTYDALGQYKIYCNIHRKMIGDIVTVPSIFYATTDSTGKYTIRDVPKGEYQLHAWHIYGGSKQQTIKVTNSAITADMKLVSTKIIREIEDHKNKKGNNYQYGNSNNSYGYDDGYGNDYSD